MTSLPSDRPRRTEQHRPGSSGSRRGPRGRRGRRGGGLSAGACLRSRARSRRGGRRRRCWDRRSARDDQERDRGDDGDRLVGSAPGPSHGRPPARCPSSVGRLVDDRPWCRAASAILDAARAGSPVRTRVEFAPRTDEAGGLGRSERWGEGEHSGERSDRCLRGRVGARRPGGLTRVPGCEGRRYAQDIVLVRVGPVWPQAVGETEGTGRGDERGALRRKGGAGSRTRARTSDVLGP